MLLTAFNLNFSKMPDFSYLWISGFKNTIIISLAALALSAVLSILLASMKLSKFRVFRWFATAYVSIFRGIPLIVWVFFVYFGVPKLLNISFSSFAAGVIALGTSSSSFLSELIRGGIQSVDHGQREAAQALGLSKLRIQFGIVLPQAIKSILPGIINEIIGVLKSSALVYSIGYTELLRATELVISSTFRCFEPYLIVGAIYYTLVMILTIIGNRVERWVRKSDIRG